MQGNTQSLPSTPSKSRDLDSPTIQVSRPKVNLWLDIAIFVAFLVTTAPRFSGVPVHEWLSLAFAAAAVIHLLLHWQWIVAVTRKFFKAAFKNQRLNYVLNVLLFIDMTVIMFTGVMISRAVLPALGIQLSAGFAWRSIHSLASDAGVIIIGLHAALHWDWIVSTFNRFVLKKPSPGRNSAPAASATAIVEQEA